MKLWEVIAQRDELRQRLAKGREKIVKEQDIRIKHAYLDHWQKLRVQYKRRCIEARWLEELES